MYINVCGCAFLNGLPCKSFFFWQPKIFSTTFFLVIRQHAPSCPQVLVLTPDNNPTVPPSADVASICRALGYQHRIAPRCLGWVVPVWRWRVFLQIFQGVTKSWRWYLLGTNISTPQSRQFWRWYPHRNQHILYQGTFEDDFPSPKVRYASSLKVQFPKVETQLKIPQDFSLSLARILLVVGNDYIPQWMLGSC